MDEAIFEAFGTYWNEEVLKFWRNTTDRIITRVSFGKILSTVWLEAMLPGNIISGFRLNGIFPFDS